MSSLPLDRVRIIAVEQYGAGPYGTQLLADLGAEVIKIENPMTGGDVSRFVSPHLIGDEDSQFFQTFNPQQKISLFGFEICRGTHRISPACENSGRRFK